MHKAGLHLTVRPVYVRDFGYPNSKRKRMKMDQEVADTTAAVFAELLSGPTVDVYVGEEKRHWRLHCRLLSYHSEYLERELQRQWDAKVDNKNSESLRLDLPNADARGFELLISYFYRGQLERVADIPDPQEKYDYAVACHRLYVLCEQFGMTKLMNRAMDEYRRGLSDAGLVPDGLELADIYSRSPAGSPFRTLMTRIAARQILDPDGDKDAGDYRDCFATSADFAIQLINFIREETGGLDLQDPTEGEGCDYHEHTDGACHIEGKGLCNGSYLQHLIGIGKLPLSRGVDSPDTPTPRQRPKPERIKQLFKAKNDTDKEINPELPKDDSSKSDSSESDSKGHIFRAAADEVSPTSTPGRRAPTKLAVRSRNQP